ncbi:S-adenosyl-L-methionine-dependent methyltransferase [Thozetella sp. PMI_491]|nr:S-adenosyl-L-methionine-dependent methyltransferase [Thozetella sp. PMI_491]
MGAAGTGAAPAGLAQPPDSPSRGGGEAPSSYHGDDRDSALGDEDRVSLMASLSSSILHYRTIHGRTYHSEKGNAEYWGPNDARQNEALDIIHHMLTLVLDGKLFRAPIKDNVQRVLDIGTGTDFADQYPHAEVIGTDISPIQPLWLPPNLRFEMEDATQAWSYPADSFDFVHFRYLFGSFTDWSALYRQAFRCCKPGGYLEDVEASLFALSDDGSVAAGTPMGRWGNLFREGGEKLGRSFTVVDDDVQRRGMEEAGFTDVTVWDFKCPLGGWPRDRVLREIGLFCHLTLEQDLEGFVLYMFQFVLGWAEEDIHTYATGLRAQLNDRSVHGYFRIRFVHGKKPEASNI